ncbi:MAG: suppressor of fused domain protein [Candidatus Eremiobacterota bacterium]
MDSAPGWDAVDASLRRLYPGQEPLHWGTLVRYSLGGPDPLDGISCYASQAERPHWHFCSFGMSELYAKESDDPDVSGWGFEFTFRIPRASPSPPSWPLVMLNDLARYVFQTGNVFEVGHHVAMGEALPEPGCALDRLVFALDPELGELETPNGRLAFLQIVAIHRDEEDVIKRWNSHGLLDLLQVRSPLLITEFDRPSVLSDPAALRAVEEGAAREGSAQASLYGTGVHFRLTPPTLTLPPAVAGDVQRLLLSRIRFGRNFVVKGQDLSVVFLPGDRLSWERNEDGLVLLIPSDRLDELSEGLEAGRYRGFAGLSVEVS